VAELTHPPVESLGVTTLLFALSDPVRLDMVRQLAAPDAAAICNSLAVDLPKSTRSHHLKLLRESGVVRMESRGREKLVSLRRDDLESRWPGLLDAVLADTPAVPAPEAAL
jgi:DNA-binding transcriptional ArsR family regulator